VAWLDQSQDFTTISDSKIGVLYLVTIVIFDIAGYKNHIRIEVINFFKIEGKMTDSEQLSKMDLNMLAIDEFRSLIESDESLSKEWKTTILRLIESGIPENLKDIEELVMGGE
jgi:hypothetical protein